MINRGATYFHPRNIHTKFDANLCTSSREEVEKTKKVHNNNDKDDGRWVIA